MTKYTFSIENAEENYEEMSVLYRQHHKEMQNRLAGEGIKISDYNPRLDEYFKASRQGYLINYVVRLEGAPVGYSNIYLTNDMHNGEFIATEDTIYILPDHRNGTGRRLSKMILADLKSRKVKRLNVTAITDLRVAKLWKRMGFLHTASAMTYNFGD